MREREECTLCNTQLQVRGVAGVGYRYILEDVYGGQLVCEVSSPPRALVSYDIDILSVAFV
jgi:hypothetical protein